MLRTRLYYALKPFLPWAVRNGVRRWFAVRKQKRIGNVWPILPGSEHPPEGWGGWPEGKQFAFVLTHDVEGPGGVAKCRQLMQLEQTLGFRSSFNFIPEGGYRVTRELREELVGNGFEVGVHDLHHDGKLFSSREAFAKSAHRINQYLRDWAVVGYRSGFMLHNLDWQHDLEVAYDASTFDTDPFEPQPDGVGTIFPFYIPGPVRAAGAPHSRLAPLSSHLTSGYVELPYTLPQDSTLFLVLRERTPDIWLRKLDWVAQHGGMALVNVHPDYLRFPGQPSQSHTFPVEHYIQLLMRVRDHYASRCWRALPREVAAFVTSSKDSARATRVMTGDSPKDPKPCGRRGRIWIDLENTPHIPFFKPIIRELEKRGVGVVTTARDAYQTCEMATRYGLTYTRIGHHYGKSRLLKTWGLFARSFQLLPFVLRERPSLAVNHGSRTQTLVCNMLRIPVISITDYEHTSELFLWRSQWEIVPSVMPDENLHWRRKGIRKYSGIKEDVYVPEFKPDSSILAELGVRVGEIIVTVRPPATEAHYHNPEAEVLFEHFMEIICRTAGVQAVLLPRSPAQSAAIRGKWPHWFAGRKVIIPQTVVEGLNLLWHSDLVVSGGGTMNREAAAMGIPVYSIFRGTIGAVDKHLVSEGRLTLIENVDDVQRKIALQPRPRNTPIGFQPRKALGDIVNHIEDIFRNECPC